MNPHFHIHTILVAGGLTPDRSRWIAIDASDEYFDVDAISREYQRLFLQKLTKLHQNEELEIPGELWYLADRARFDEWLKPLAQKSWIVNCQSTPDWCQGPDAAIRYLSRYVAGTAIADTRIIRDEDGQVTFSAKDYRHDGEPITVTLSGIEFVKRFARHILPRAFYRVRYYGLLGMRDRYARMGRCRELLGVAPIDTDVQSSDRDANLEEQAREERQTKRCPGCGEMTMRWLGTLQFAEDGTPLWHLLGITTLPDMPHQNDPLESSPLINVVSTSARPPPGAFAAA